MTFDQLFVFLYHDLQISILPVAIQFTIFLSPLLLLVTLVWIFWPLWVNYVQSKNILNTQYTVLEVRLPKETFKSPRAMEVFLNSLHNTSDGSAYAQFWEGKTRPWFSLEIISIEGQVKFMLWMESVRKSGVMSALYSQYPNVEIQEREDYTRSVHFDPKDMKMWAGEFIFTKDDPYPIKTYVDYGLDKDPKEEFKVDPLLPMLEFLGSVGPNQQVWIQLLIRAHKKDQHKPGHLFAMTDLWQDRAKELVNELMIRDPKTKGTVKNPEKPDELVNIPRLSEGEKDVIAAIERSVSKLAFDTCIRAIYVAKKEFFNTPFGIGGIVANMKQFSTENLNGFKPNGEKWVAQFNGHPFEDYRDMRRNRQSKLALMAYKRRSIFYPPFEGKTIVMNTEELATIFHFPGSVAMTPTLERIPSKRSQAPSNLPI